MLTVVSAGHHPGGAMGVSNMRLADKRPDAKSRHAPDTWLPTYRHIVKPLPIRDRNGSKGKANLHWPLQPMGKHIAWSYPALSTKSRW